MSSFGFSCLRAGLAVIAVLGCAQVVCAAPGSTPANEGSGRAASADDPALGEAAILYEQAQRAAREGDHARALDLMQRAYELSGHAWLLYNLGLLHHQLGHCELALESLERYLTEVRESARLEHARELVEKLRLHCGAETAEGARMAPAASAGDRVEPTSAAVSAVPLQVELPPSGESARPPVAPPDAERRSGTARRSVGWVVLGGGVVALGAAAYYGWSAKEHADDLDDAVRAARVRPQGERPAWSSGAEALAAERDSDRTRAVAFSIFAGAFIGAGLTMLLVSSEGPRDARSVDLQIAGDRLYASYTAPAF